MHQVDLVSTSTTIALGGTDTTGPNGTAGYRLHQDGLGIEEPPAVMQKTNATLLRSSAKVIAHAHGNRLVTVTFLVWGTDQNDTTAKIGAVRAMLEQGVRAQEREESFAADAVYLRLRLDGSTKVHYFQVAAYQMPLPKDLIGWPWLNGYVERMVLQLECRPNILEGRRTFLEDHTSGTNAAGSGFPVAASSYTVLPAGVTLRPAGGIISGWFYPTYAPTSTAVTVYTHLHETSGNLIFRKRASAATYDFITIVTGSVTKTVSITTATGGVVQNAWNHFAVQWGDAVPGSPDASYTGMQLWVNGIRATTGNVGDTTAILSTTGDLGKIFVGVSSAVTNPGLGAMDDLRISRSWDNIFFDSPTKLETVGREPNQYSLISTFTGLNKGGSCTATLTNVRGQLAPQIELAVQMAPNPTSNTYARVRIAGYAASAAFVPYLEAETFTLDGTNAPTAAVVVDAARSGTGYLNAGNNRTHARTATKTLTTNSYRGNLHLFGVVRTLATSRTVQLRFTQGNTYTVACDTQTIAAATAAFQVVELGTIALPLAPSPDGQNPYTTTIELWDNGQVYWDAVFLAPYDETQPLLMASPTAAFANTERLLGVADPGTSAVYRYDQSTGTTTPMSPMPQGGVPTLHPNKTNTLSLLVSRSDSSVVITDGWTLAAEYWPRYLTLR